MSLEYIFPDHTKRNRRIAIAVEIVMAVVAIVLIIWAINRWQGQGTVPAIDAPVDPIAEKVRILQESNPIIVLTEEEVRAKEAALQEPNPIIQLTEEQVRERRAVVENI